MTDTAPPHWTRDVGLWRTATLLSVAGFGALVLFTAAPDLDVAAAALWGGSRGFPLERAPAVEAARLVYHAAFVAMIAVSLAGLAGRLAAPAATRVPARLWAYPAALAALGPGLLVNLWLKAEWGRARPGDLAAFGGEADFTGPFVVTMECASNCSFVSGEGSAAAAAAAAAAALFWPRGAGARGAGLAAMGLWLAGAAWMRIAPGAHFLSDSLFAFILTGLVACALYVALGVGAMRRGVTAGDYGRDLLAAGEAVRDLVAPALVRIFGQSKLSS